MKSILDNNQRKKMYGTKRSSTRTAPSDTDLVITESADIVLFEVSGKKHVFASHGAYVKLVNENKTLKDDIRTIVRELKAVREFARRLGYNLDIIHEELQHKVDKP